MIGCALLLSEVFLRDYLVGVIFMRLLMLSMALFFLCACEQRKSSFTGELWEEDPHVTHHKANYTAIAVQYMDDGKSIAVMKIPRKPAYLDDDIAFIYEIPDHMPKDVKLVSRCDIAESMMSDSQRNTITGSGSLTLTFADGSQFVIRSSKVGFIDRSDKEVIYRSEKIHASRNFGIRGEEGAEKSLATKIALTPVAITGDVTVFSLQVAGVAATLPLWLPLIIMLHPMN